MESQKFEELEEVEQEEGYVPEAAPALKEYEKLLLAESNRQLNEKAVSLIKFGCFEQKQEPVVDFNKYTKIDTEKKYKGLYDLYQDNDTNELVFICPLVEDNKGDDQAERKDLAPYAYDMIITEAMDEETYQMVCKAAKNNITTLVSVLYKIAYIAYIAIVVLALYSVVYNLVAYADNGFWPALGYTIFYAGTYVCASVVALPFLVLMSIKYKAYKEQ